MKETILPKNISANIGRAAQDEIDGYSRSELSHLLFAARDIAEVLNAYRANRMSRPPTAWLDSNVAKRYATSLRRISKRIAELIEDGA